MRGLYQRGHKLYPHGHVARGVRIPRGQEPDFVKRVVRTFNQNHKGIQGQGPDAGTVPAYWVAV